MEETRSVRNRTRCFHQEKEKLTLERDRFLISAVKRYPELWHKSALSNSDVHLFRLWKNVAKELSELCRDRTELNPMSVDGLTSSHYTVYRVKVIWKSLTDKVKKHLRKIEADRRRSETLGRPLVQRAPIWPLWNDLEFVREILENDHGQQQNTVPSVPDGLKGPDQATPLWNNSFSLNSTTDEKLELDKYSDGTRSSLDNVPSLSGASLTPDGSPKFQLQETKQFIKEEPYSDYPDDTKRDDIVDVDTEFLVRISSETINKAINNLAYLKIKGKQRSYLRASNVTRFCHVPADEEQEERLPSVPADTSDSNLQMSDSEYEARGETSPTNSATLPENPTDLQQSQDRPPSQPSPSAQPEPEAQNSCELQKPASDSFDVTLNPTVAFVNDKLMKLQYKNPRFAMEMELELIELARKYQLKLMQETDAAQ